MPIYDYKCTKGHVFEDLANMRDMSERLCPECSEVAKRQLSLGIGVTHKMKPGESYMDSPSFDHLRRGERI